MASAAIGAVLGVVLYFIFETLIKLVLSSATWISSVIMDSSIRTFGEGENLIQSFVNLLPFSNEAKGVTLDIFGLIDGLSYAVLLLCVISAGIKIATTSVDNRSESIPKTLSRFVVAIFLKKLIFGTTFISFSGLLSTVGEAFASILTYVSNFTIDPASINLDTFSFNFSPVTYIAQLLLYSAILASVVSAAITYIERVLSFALYTILGPIAVSLYASKDTEHVAKEWILGLFTQFGAIALCLVGWALFLNQLDSVLRLDATLEGTKVIFMLAIAVAILGLVRNSEKIFNAMGLRTMANMDSARALGAGLASLGSTALMATRLATSGGKNLANHFSNVKHGSKPAIGGQGAINKLSSTGNARAYNKEGVLSVNNSGKHVAAWVTGNHTGANRVGLAQKNQKDAIGYLNSQTAQTIGSKVSGTTLNDKQYTSAQIANLATSGYANGTGSGFRFVGDNLTVAQTTSLSGNTVTGVMGEAEFVHKDGTATNLGQCFMATSAGEQEFEIPMGSKLDVGNQEANIFFEGTEYALDEEGAMFYQLHSSSNEPSSQDTETSQKDEPTQATTTEEVFGNENIESSTQVDPTCANPPTDDPVTGSIFLKDAESVELDYNAPIDENIEIMDLNNNPFQKKD